LVLKGGVQKSSERNIIKSLDNSLTLLEYMSHHDGMRITEISRDLKIDVSTAHRILKTMARRGFVEQDPETRKYHLGLSAQLMGSTSMRQTNLHRFGWPFLEALSRVVDETINLVIRNQWDAVYITQVESRNTLRVANQVGNRVPLYCTAAGKVLLAGMDKDLRRQYYKEVKLVPLTVNTITSKGALEGEIKRIRETQIAYDREEQAMGEACVATPVFARNRETVAAISVSFPVSRLVSKDMKMESIAGDLIDCAKRISEKLGFN
jgi:DNA-binding IclR family transcriptional regulator